MFAANYRIAPGARAKLDRETGRWTVTGILRDESGGESDWTVIAYYDGTWHEVSKVHAQIGQAGWRAAEKSWADEKDSLPRPERFDTPPQGEVTLPDFIRSEWGEWWLIVLSVALLFLCFVAPPLLAARKGYAWYLWTIACGLIGLAVLAFLPFANKPGASPRRLYFHHLKAKQLRQVANVPPGLLPLDL
jgi:hypothetical protein